MYKKLSILFLLMIIFSVFCAISTSAKGLMLEYDGSVHEYTGSVYQLQVNSRPVQTPMEPIIFNDRALVPLREVFETLGADVTYDNADKRVNVSMNGNSISVSIDNPIAYINGQSTTIPDNITPKLIAKVGENAKTMVPVRFISENIGMNVNFDGNNGIIDIVKDTQKNVINDISCEAKSDTQYIITIRAKAAIANYHDFTLTSPERVVVDIPDTSYVTANTINVNQGAISTIRLGDDGTRARIVVDTQSIQSYTVEQSAGKNVLTITLNTKTPVIQKPAATPAPTPTPTQTPVQQPQTNTSSKLIVLDAGHGGQDGGASGTYNGKTIYEKDLTLSITKKVQSILQEKGCSVLMTRDGDTYPELTERSDLANEHNAALFISIHINSVENAPSAHGTEVYYSTKNNGDTYGATSKSLAQNILNEVIPLTGARNRGVKTENHVVTRTSNMPATLVEVGFISNTEELGKMLDETYQWAVAQGIANGIQKTLTNINLPQ